MITSSIDERLFKAVFIKPLISFLNDNEGLVWVYREANLVPIGLWALLLESILTDAICRFGVD
jgi:hypothetical protein